MAAGITGRGSRFLIHVRHSGYLLPATLTGYLWLKGSQHAWTLPGFPCPMRALTGIPCPTCFLTRATCSSLSGRLDEAFHWHAFGPLVAMALLVWSFDAIRFRRLRPRGLRSWHLISASVALLSYWILRVGLSYGFGIPTFPTG